MFTGNKGSGKSTLINILTGLLPSTSVTTLINGKDVKLTDKGWQNLVSYIPQEVFLFDASVRENVTLHPTEVNTERLNLALEKAAMHKLVDELPLGVETPVGERGSRLSGGQRQRLALARAFYHQRKIIFLDEATSALDNDTEAEIVNALENLDSDITIVMIAHRLSSLQFCQQVWEVDRGTLIARHTLPEEPATQTTSNGTKAQLNAEERPSS